MIEKTIIDHLKTALAPVNVSAERKGDATKQVVVEKTGGGMGDATDHALIKIQSYGASLFEASQLNDQVKSAMLTLPTVTNVTKVDLNTDYNYTDTTKKHYRYQAIYDIWHY